MIENVLELKINQEWLKVVLSVSHRPKDLQFWTKLNKNIEQNITLNYIILIRFLKKKRLKSFKVLLREQSKLRNRIYQDIKWKSGKNPKKPKETGNRKEFPEKKIITKYVAVYYEFCE